MRVAYENQQWRVTDTTLESIDPRSKYVIPLAEILGIRETGRERFYKWPLQVAEKSWVDIEAFIAAFRFAVQGTPVDQVILEETITKSRQRG